MKYLVTLFSLIFSFGIFFAADMVANIDLSCKEINVKENAFGNFAADALRKKAGSELAVVAAQSFNANSAIKKGKFTENDLKGMLSTPNSSVVVLKLSSAEVLDMFERSVSIVPQGSSAFLQVSGAVIIYNAQNNTGSRIVKATVNGAEVTRTSNKTYSVAMPLELGRGGNGYIRVFSSSSIAEMKVTDYTLLSSVTEYIKELATLNFSTSSRIAAQ